MTNLILCVFLVFATDFAISADTQCQPLSIDYRCIASSYWCRRSCNAFGSNGYCASSIICRCTCYSNISTTTATTDATIGEAITTETATTETATTETATTETATTETATTETATTETATTETATTETATTETPTTETA